ncbi:MAG: hypothetical protein P0Y55_14370 [Candidatus Cohnella colombiensis]|uniref:Uncharacterized protein n=1 Tax=Candidatus Cohnella colombiensis TaxID=3121368 RepID=A0AA95F2U0_9BACL|nr:MAG: hypothetical protein P0Y55_14370 [Cohnella sp.]
MYPKVNSPKKDVSKEWLDQAFAPLQDYLNRRHQEDVNRIMVFMMFMGNNDDKFYYKNSITRSYIVFDQSGQLVSLADDALEYRFEWLERPRRKSPPTKPEHTHPNVYRWIEKKLSKKDALKYGEELRLFLQEIWGPMCNYDFSDLVVGYPFRGRRTPNCLYLYPSKHEKLIAFQFPGDEFVERSCGMRKYNDYRMTEQELRLEGWQIEVIWREYLESDVAYLVNNLVQFIELADWRDPVFVLTPAARELVERSGE